MNIVGSPHKELVDEFASLMAQPCRKAQVEKFLLKLRANLAGEPDGRWVAEVVEEICNRIFQSPKRDKWTNRKRHAVVSYGNSRLLDCPQIEPLSQILQGLKPPFPTRRTLTLGRLQFYRITEKDRTGLLPSQSLSSSGADPYQELVDDFLSVMREEPDPGDFDALMIRFRHALSDNASGEQIAQLVEEVYYAILEVPDDIAWRIRKRNGVFSFCMKDLFTTRHSQPLNEILEVLYECAPEDDAVVSFAMTSVGPLGISWRLKSP